MFHIYDGRTEFYQWDVDRQLVVEDSSITQVHFCNKTDDCSLVVEVYEQDGVYLANVPNILLQTDWNIRVYGYDRKYTKHSAIFKVNARTKPNDYAYTETEILNWTKVNERVDEVEDVAYDALIEAENVANFTLSLHKNVDNISSQVMRLDYDMQEVIKPKLEELEDKKANNFSSTKKGENINIKDHAGGKFNSFKLYCKTKQAATPTLDNPQELSRSSSINLNLINKNFLSDDITDINNWVNPSLSGSTPEASYDYFLSLPAGTYTFDISRVNSDSAVGYLYLKREENGAWKTLSQFVITSTGIQSLTKRTFTIEEGYTYKLWFYDKKTFSNLTNWQIRRANDTADYEPQVKQTLTVTGTINDGGIPVTAGGNYIDEKGQQWVCDEYDFTTGKKIGWIKTVENIPSFAYQEYNPTNKEDGYYVYTVTGANATNFKGALCNYFTYKENGHENTTSGECFSMDAGRFYIKTTIPTIDEFRSWLDTHNFVIKYIGEQEETNINKTIIDAYKELIAYKPVTNIYTGEGAGIEVNYDTDLQSYIDAKFTELQQAIISMGGNV